MTKKTEIKSSKSTVASNAAVSVKDLRMRYGETDVLKGVNFTINRGEVVVLLGPNGAGKTTTIEILEGFRMRSAGKVSVLGVDPSHGNEAWRAKLGVVLQSWRDHSRWRVGELLEHLGKYYEAYSTPKRHRPLVTGDLLEMVGLSDFRDQKIGDLSGGQRRRMDVAIGLVGNPEVLFLDEPTVGFDPEARRSFHDVIHRLSDLEDTAILLTTHDLDEAEKLGDRIMILAGGKIVANGSANQLAKEALSQAEVRWTHAGKQTIHSTDNPVKFVRELFAQHSNLEDLEVRRASLEDTYIKIVHHYETGQSSAGIKNMGGSL